MRSLGFLFVTFLTLAACGGNDADPTPTPRADAGTCDLAPAEGGCCFDDGDCTGSERCYAFTCGAGGEGRCQLPAPVGRCWDSGDCAAGTTCQDVQLCECGARCLVEDSPGTCS
jgi:hypothetical protein